MRYTACCNLIPSHHEHRRHFGMAVLANFVINFFISNIDFGSDPGGFEERFEPQKHRRPRRT